VRDGYSKSHGWKAAIEDVIILSELASDVAVNALVHVTTMVDGPLEDETVYMARLGLPEADDALLAKLAVLLVTEHPVERW
jgi:hypothetical protein